MPHYLSSIPYGPFPLLLLIGTVLGTLGAEGQAPVCDSSLRQISPKTVSSFLSMSSYSSPSFTFLGVSTHILLFHSLWSHGSEKRAEEGSVSGGNTAWRPEGQLGLGSFRKALSQTRVQRERRDVGSRRLPDSSGPPCFGFCSEHEESP